MCVCHKWPKMQESYTPSFDGLGAGLSDEHLFYAGRRRWVTSFWLK
jgi:hypothetical protein